MTYYYFTNELYHHGIKGMRWGVRRYRNEDGTLTEAGKKRYQKENFKKIAKAKHKSKNNSEVLDKTIVNIVNDNPQLIKKIDQIREKEEHAAILRKKK